MLVGSIAACGPDPGPNPIASSARVGGRLELTYDRSAIDLVAHFRAGPELLTFSGGLSSAVASIVVEADLPRVQPGQVALMPLEVSYAPDSPGPAPDTSGRRPVLLASDAPGQPHAEQDGTATEVAESTIALRPFDDCDPGVACDRTVVLRVAWRSPRADLAISGSWSIDASARLPMGPSFTPPPGAELTIDVQAREVPPA